MTVVMILAIEPKPTKLLLREIPLTKMHEQAWIVCQLIVLEATQNLVS